MRHLPLIISAALVAIALYIFGLVLDDFYLRLVTKPFPIIAMIVIAASSQTPYSKGIATGLTLCLLGDVLLEFRQTLFLPGMIAFLLGHVAYVVTFVRRTRRLSPLLAVPFLLWIGWALSTLWGGLGPMQIPVGAYTVAIFVMMWRAAAVVADEAAPNAFDWCALAGAALFGFSDTLIALDRFGESIEGVRIPIILTYWLAQSLITASVFGSRDSNTSLKPRA